jgi:hypothetical protein
MLFDTARIQEADMHMFGLQIMVIWSQANQKQSDLARRPDSFVRVSARWTCDWPMAISNVLPAVQRS